MGLFNATVNTGRTLSVVVPAFNEEKNLPATIESIHQSLAGVVSKYEIIIVNDGSRDSTGNVAAALAEKDTTLKVMHNQKNSGYGYTFWRGAAAATCKYVQLIPADNEIPADSIGKIAKAIGKADLLLPYIENFEVRSFIRKLISVTYTGLLNCLFRLRIKYYNGPFIVKASVLNDIHVRATGFAFMASIVIQAIRVHKCTYAQIGIRLKPRTAGKSSLTVMKIVSIFKTIAWLFWNVNINRYIRGTSS